ncbi:MAG: winged helix-turn-helix transcriptional regulator [Hyphomicrobiales bacterium]
MDINTLVKVTSRAWSLHILSLMHSGTPGRQAALLSASGAGRTAFAQSLSHLVALNLLERNPGHGHPLRPEYRLTTAGASFAKAADRIKQAVREQSEHPLLRRAWTVPILAVSPKPIYFKAIRTRLGPITDRALSQSLKQLESKHWIRRDIDAAMHPPRPLYQAVNIGAQISDAVGLGIS